MVNASLISRLSHAVDLIEQRSQQNRPWKIVTVRRGLKEDPDAAVDRPLRGPSRGSWREYRDLRLLRMIRKWPMGLGATAGWANV